MASTPATAKTSTVNPADDPAPVTAAELRKVARANFIGNFVEWFDYACYAYLAVTIASVFFPDDTGGTALVKTFGVFALSFIVRPFGGIVWGHIGDRVGRRTALSTSILVMSAATFLIAFIPTHSAIGVAAPVLLIALRMVQGFSAAGEYAGTSSFLAEFAPEDKRGRYTALVPASTACGLLLGSILVAVMTAALTAEQMTSWGWRLPFLLAAPLGLVGLYLRTRVPETPAFRRMQQTASREHRRESSPLRAVLAHPRALAVSFAIALMNAAGFYLVLTYLPTYLSEVVNVGKTESFVAASIALTAYIGLVFVAGVASDRLGRKRLLLASAALFVMLSVPAFVLLGLSGIGIAAIVAVQVGMGAILALNDGVLPAAMTEQFATPVRYTGFALVFNVANALFGGTAPMIATALIAWTGSNLAPAWYLVAVAAVTFVGVLLAREGTHKPLQA